MTIIFAPARRRAGRAKGGSGLKTHLTFDVGTTAMKCVLFDADLSKLAQTGREYSLLTPSPDRVEIDPRTYWDVFLSCLEEIGAKFDLKEVATLTFTTQGETLIAADASLTPLSNAIVWIDARASEEAERIAGALSEADFYALTGLPSINGALPLAKLLWIKKNLPDVYEKTHKFLLLEDYLIARLTGRCVSEKSLLSSTGWFDVHKETYLSPLLESLGLDEDKLPPILPCGVPAGTVCESAAKASGLSTGTTVTTGAMDQVCSAIGAGNVKSGIVTETTGTALVVGATAPEADPSCPGRITVYKHFDGSFLYMPYCNTAGIVLKWFKDNFLEELTARARTENKGVYALVDELAATSSPGSNGVTMLTHFAGKPAPGAIDGAKGVIFGLSLATKKKDVARALLEGVAYMLNEALLSLENAGVKVGEVRSLGGGSYSPLWGQIKADVCNKPFLRMKEAESTSLGAAVLGRCALDRSTDPHSLALSLASPRATFSPDGENRAVYEAGYRRYLSLYRALEGEFTS